MTCKYNTQRLDLSNLFPEIDSAFAIILDDVFTLEECNEMIQKTEELGYSEALVGYSQVRVVESRNNYRCMIDDEAMADMIYQRIKDHIPVEWFGKKVECLNPRLRFLKYNPGEYFKPHMDGKYTNKQGTLSSYVTVQLYLNDVDEANGGATTFTTEPRNYHNHKGAIIKEDIKTLSVQPKVGRVLIFEHSLLHCGSTLKAGLKYCVRTDVLYNNTKKSKTRYGNITCDYCKD